MVAQLSVTVDSHMARARYEWGVLVILFPKIKEKRKKDISTQRARRA
ncbi:MAG: hypothetical protein AAB014_04905 [Nitrospirota bacterium]